MKATKRVHVALNTKALGASVDFYRRFFRVEPVKLASDYAKFDLPELGLNFTLNAVKTGDGASPTRGALNHLGIQVSSPEEVRQASERLAASGLTTREETDTVCCYARQDKIWVSDPDGRPWEVFVVKEDVPAESAAKVEQSSEDREPCCAPTCCS